MILDKTSYGRALAAAYAADIARAPSIQRAVAAGQLPPRALVNMMLRDLAREVKGLYGTAFFPNLRAFLRETMDVEAAKRGLPSGMGEWAELATALVGAAASTATKVYSAKIETETAKKLAEIEAKKQEAAIRAAEIQAQTARLQYAQSETSAARAASSTSAGPPLGIPVWGWALGLVTLGGVGYLVLRPRGRR